ncbi:helix-turn-helix domain-containing protein [Microbacterium esteraromaticum]|uniref:helix-turn-helix domain-containing protein n=1 Tax=Microbacterium esteraromaticum TaxID=57043 RepID=UPI00240826FA|nr:helix-turn-helix transcriptional regulator [Microbacterium esteraromaticum]
MDNTGDAFNAAVAAELRAQRGRIQMTIDTLVRHTGLSKSAVLNYLNGKRDIPVPALFALCSALNVSPHQIFDLAERTLGAERVPGARNDYDLVANETINEFPAGDDADWDSA